MDQGLLNDIISTSIGGAAGGAVAGIVIMAIQGLRAMWLDCRDAGRVFRWLKETTAQSVYPWRSTRAIASYTNLTQDRVRFVCSQDERIKLSTKDDNEVWGLRNAE